MPPRQSWDVCYAFVQQPHGLVEPRDEKAIDRKTGRIPHEDGNLAVERASHQRSTASERGLSLWVTSKLSVDESREKIVQTRPQATRWSARPCRPP